MDAYGWLRFPGEREPNEREVGEKMLGDILLCLEDTPRVSQQVLFSILWQKFGLLGILGHLFGS